ncbi:MAG: ABC transporter permease [Spirochaetes bacterium]|nr:ABC transporter permease [Spirochaetota bacterium]
MKDKIFLIVFYSILIIISLFFIVLIFSIITQLNTKSTVSDVNTNELLFAVRLTIMTATASSLLAILFSIPIAYILARYDFMFKNFIDAILYLPIVISPIALGAMLLIFFNTAAGRFFEDHIFRVVFEVPGIILSQFIVIIGLSISLVRAVFEYIDPVYEDIARTLGSTRFQAFRNVIIPLSKKGLVSTFLLIWARAVGEFGATVTLAGATTLKTETLPIAIFLSFASADIYSACIFILISLVISLSILFFIRKLYARSKKSFI